MPLNSHTDERNERRVIIILYSGTLVILFILLYATYANMLQFRESAYELRRYNSALVEMGGLLDSIQEQERAVHGCLLTGDTMYLGSMTMAQQRSEHYTTRLESLLSGSSWQAQLSALRHAQVRVSTSLAALLGVQGRAPMDRSTMARELDRQRAFMTTYRENHARIAAAISTQREAHVERQRVWGVSTPIVLMLFSLLAVAATALLYWRVSHALHSAEKAKLDLRSKLTELATEVKARTSVQQMLERVLDSSPNGIITFRAIRNEQGRIVEFLFLTLNQGATELLGRTDLVGRSLLQVMPEYRTNGLFDAYVSVVESGVPFRTEIPYYASGQDKWVADHAVRLEDGFMVTRSDITEQRRAREVHAETERVALTGQIARTVAHEVRNPLTNIHLAMEQLRDEVKDRVEEADPFFTIIDRNVKRIGDLINGMLESSRKRDLNLEFCSLEDIVDHAMEQVQDRLRLKHVKGVVEIAKDLPRVVVDRELIGLAIINIAINAVEAMDDGNGELRMQAYRAGNEVWLEISDNGKGVPSEDLARLFEPFYSGRPGGLGLGLTSTRNILNSHQIQMDANSKVGIGTTFILRFPSSVLPTTDLEDAPARGQVSAL